MRIAKFAFLVLLPLQVNAGLTLDQSCLTAEPTNMEFFYTNGMLTSSLDAKNNLSKVEKFIKVNKENINLNKKNPQE